MLLVDATGAAAVMLGFYDRAEEEMVAALASGDPRDAQTAGIDRFNGCWSRVRRRSRG
ncbi:hypothetical protein TPA0908_33520 [Micromonospora sp. AKA38]|nr:hypothetical protein TPA0908_33520 [Micromonospora sp. AKA38]